MPDYRKPPVEKSSRQADGSLQSDSLEFSIETTTMRLKSLRLRRAEAADREIDEKLRSPATQPTQRPLATGPAGRVRHDERGMAVWDWAVATGEHAALSATNIMRKLEVAELKIEETQRAKTLPSSKAAPPGDPYNTGGGSGDPYNTRASRPSDPTRRPPPAPGRSGGSVLDQLTGKKK